MLANEHLIKPEAFWKQVLWTDEVTVEVLATMSECVCLEEKRYRTVLTLTE